MSLIFDKFPDDDEASMFATAVREKFGLEWQIYSSVKDAMAHDPFPYELFPPVVHIDRPDDEDAATEREVAKLVTAYGGRFAGT